jgi:Rieske 2Fe-2S family protein
MGDARLLPRAAYVDQAVLAWEREHLFDGGWVCAGRTADVARPRQQLAVRAGVTGVVLVRDDGGLLRAFANHCRHRGHELLACGERAERGALVCPYHRWSFHLDGRLRSAPRVGEGTLADPESLALVPVEVAEWGGWVFVNADGTAPPLADHVGALDGIVAPWRTDDLVVAATRRYDLAANWKVAIENYHECAHCPPIHPELCRVTVADSGRNFRTEPGAFVGGTMELAGHAATMSADGRRPVPPLPGLSAREQRQVLYVQLFPNLLVALHPDYVLTHRIEPVDATRSTVVCDWLFHPDTVGSPGFDPAYAVEFWDLVNRQDWAAVESVQRGLASPLFVPGVFASNEDAVYQFATMTAGAYLGGPLRRGTLPDDFTR